MKKPNSSWLMLCLSLCVFAPAAWTRPALIHNPYADVNWSTVGQHRANLHTHTTESDGGADPDAVIDLYYEKGYTILAITDHNKCTWPWQDWNRDPAALGMLAIPGNEASRHDHINSFFIDYETASTSEEQTLAEIGAAGGLALINHPGRYWSLDGENLVPESVVPKYVEWFVNFPHAIGLEVFNSWNRYPHDIYLWDAVLTELMPERPVWGIANDDMHVPMFSQLSWNTFLLEELSESALREAMEQGRFYCSTTGNFNSQPFSRLPLITGITHDPFAGTITISSISSGAPLPDENCRWISVGGVVGIGATLDYAHTEGIAKYVRAELTGQGGITLTNPFGLGETGTLTVVIDPVAAVYEGAQWRIAGIPDWHDSEATVDLAPGDYMIHFKNIRGWETPDPVAAVVVSETTTVVSGTEGALYEADPHYVLSVWTPWGQMLLLALGMAAGWFVLKSKQTRSSC